MSTIQPVLVADRARREAEEKEKLDNDRKQVMYDLGSKGMAILDNIVSEETTASTTARNISNVETSGRNSSKVETAASSAHVLTKSKTLNVEADRSSAKLKKSKTIARSTTTKIKKSKTVDTGNEETTASSSSKLKRRKTTSEVPNKFEETTVIKDSKLRDVAAIRAVYAQVRKNKAKEDSSNIDEAIERTQKKTAKERLNNVIHQVKVGTHQVRMQKKVMEIFPDMMQVSRVKQIVQEEAIPAFKAQKWEDVLTALTKASHLASQFEEGAEIRKEIQKAIQVCLEILDCMSEAERLRGDLLTLLDADEFDELIQAQLSKTMQKAQLNCKRLGILCTDLQCYITSCDTEDEEFKEFVFDEEPSPTVDFFRVIKLAERSVATFKEKFPDKWNKFPTTIHSELLHLHDQQHGNSISTGKADQDGVVCSEHAHDEGYEYGVDREADSRLNVVSNVVQRSFWSRASVAAKAFSAAGWISVQGKKEEREIIEQPSECPKEESVGVLDADFGLGQEDADKQMPHEPAPNASSPTGGYIYRGCPKTNSFFDRAFIIDPKDGDGAVPAEGEPPPLLYVRRVDARKHLERQLEQDLEGNVPTFENEALNDNLSRPPKARQLLPTLENEDVQEVAISDPIVFGRESYRRCASSQWDEEKLAVHYHLAPPTPSSYSSSVVVPKTAPRASSARPRSSELTRRHPVLQRANRHVESVYIACDAELEQPSPPRVHQCAEATRRKAAEASAARANRVPDASDFLSLEDESLDTVADANWGGPSGIGLRRPIGRKPATGDYWTMHRMQSLHSKFARDATPRDSLGTLCEDDPRDRPRPRPSSAPGHSRKAHASQDICKPTSEAGPQPRIFARISTGYSQAGKSAQQQGRPQTARSRAQGPHTAPSEAQRPQSARSGSQQKRPGSARILTNKVEWWCEHLQQRDAILTIP